LREDPPAAAAAAADASNWEHLRLWPAEVHHCEDLEPAEEPTADTAMATGEAAGTAADIAVATLAAELRGGARGTANVAVEKLEIDCSWVGDGIAAADAEEVARVRAVAAAAAVDTETEGVARSCGRAAAANCGQEEGQPTHHPAPNYRRRHPDVPRARDS